MADDPVLFLLRSREKCRHIDQRQKRYPKTVAEPDKPRHLVRCIAVNRTAKADRVVRHDTDYVSVKNAKTDDRILCKIAVDFIETFVQQNVVDHCVHIVRVPGIIRHEILKTLRRVRL